MDEQEHIRHSGLIVRITGLIFLLIGASLAGLWLGEKSVEITPPPPKNQGEEENAAASPPPAPSPPPAYFRFHFPTGRGREIVFEEIQMAANAGIHQYVIDVPLPWEGHTGEILKPIQTLARIDPRATMLLELCVDPPLSWLAGHPQDALHNNSQPLGYACPASGAWKKDIKKALTLLLKTIETLPNPHCVKGFLLTGLENGAWQHPLQHDPSPAHLIGFRQWLETQYPADDDIQAAWGQPNVSTGQAVIPQNGHASNASHMLLSLPEEQPIADFRRYLSETTAAALNEIAAFLKNQSARPFTVLAPYGFTFEASHPNTGHFSLALLLDGPLDGFLSPISYHDRGLGGAGGMMGPVDSALLHGKKWFLLDDTRTGLTLDPATGQVKKRANLRPKDVYGVQQRNFAAALTHRLGILWADPNGDGRLYDPTMWEHFGEMAQAYTQTLASATPCGSPHPVMALIVDETSQLYLQTPSSLSPTLLIQARDCALRAGIPAKFYLLADLLQQNVPPASIYLFLNPFCLTPSQRDTLHTILDKHQATAIWLYAPGYYGETGGCQAVAATVQMDVKIFDGPETAGSTYALDGKWIQKDEAFGAAQTISPLFYIEDPQTDTIARYRASGKPSIAVKFFEQGATSIFCAEPHLSAPLLREFVGILELPTFFPKTLPPFYDTCHFAPGLIALHAKETGDRLISLPQPCDIQDILLPQIGWLRKQSFHIQLKTGETRILKITPLNPLQESPESASNLRPEPSSAAVAE